MPTEEFVMRGQTASATEEILNFGMKDGYAFRLIEFEVYPSTNVATTEFEGVAALTAAKVAEDPINPNFSNEGLIGTAACLVSASSINPATNISVINDTYLISQNLILSCRDTSGNPVNWQCKFKPVKLTDAGQANVNYRQFSVFDD